MHKITVTESYARNRDGTVKTDESYNEPLVNGLLAHIRPPVQLAQAAVRQFIGHGTFEENYPDKFPREIGDPHYIGKATLIGSSTEQTTIALTSAEDFPDYASFICDLGERTVDLLGYLGIGAQYQSIDVYDSDHSSEDDYTALTLPDGVVGRD